MEQTILYVCAAGGLAGIAAVLAVFVNHSKCKRDSNLEILKTQVQAMQVSFEGRLDAIQADSKSNSDAFRVQIEAMRAGFDSQLKALTESVTSWKGLWEASQLEIRELKMEIKELRIENDKLRTEIVELKGQLKEHYKLA